MRFENSPAWVSPAGSLNFAATGMISGIQDQGRTMISMCYEADGAMIYDGRPTRFAPEVEALIVNAIQKIMPAGFK